MNKPIKFKRFSQRRYLGIQWTGKNLTQIKKHYPDIPESILNQLTNENIGMFLIGEKVSGFNGFKYSLWEQKKLNENFVAFVAID